MSKLRTIVARSLLATTALVFAGLDALAGEDTDTQAITGTVAGDCTVSVPDATFGAITGTAKVIVTFDVTVACTVKPIASTGVLAANAGAHFSSSTRNIEGAAGSPKPLMPYEIYLGADDSGIVMGDTIAAPAPGTHPAPTQSVALSEISPTVIGFAAVLDAAGSPRPEGSFSDSVLWTLTF